MELSRFKQDEHEKYYFGYSSSEIYSNLENTLTKSIQIFLEESEAVLLEENDESKRDLILKETAELKDLYLKQCMTVLNQFKNVLRNIFDIPENASIYEEYTKDSYNEEQVSLMRKEVEDLEWTFLQEKMFLQTLKLEKEMIEKLEPSFLEARVRLMKLKDEAEIKRAERLKKLCEKHDSYLNKCIGEDDSNKPIVQKDFSINIDL
ncbi:hypothetical protein HHI36_006457 [Cryptolaemus montrouzieri]|uniref:Uncharacterized protein n=1 Tax=Cryptolaemus montrouzieri TaxID=559131 RepID=A0ABD2NX69_9CUCU